MKNAGSVLGIILVVVLAVLLLGGAGMMGFGGFGMMGPGMMGGYGGYGGMMGGYGNQFGFGFNPIGAILSLVLWALIIGSVVLLVVWLVRNANASAGVQRGGLSAGSSESPLDILKARYAKGEITKEQFDQMRRDLGA